MKKSIIALTAALNMATALAATTASTTTSSTDLNSSTLDKILKNTTVSYYGAYYKSNQADVSGDTTFYNEVTASFNYGSGSVFVRPRFEATDRDNVKTDQDESSLYMRNPRIGINPFSYKNGNFSTATQFRMTVAIDAAEDNESSVKAETHYGVFRASQVASYSLTNNLTLTGFAALYENIIKDDDKATDANKDQMDLLLDAAISYKINDQHSLSADYEMISTLEEGALRGADKDFYTNNDSGNTLYVRYTNSMIKNLSISPGAYLGKAEVAKADNLGVQLELSAKF